METLTFDFPAAEPGRGRTLVGCVSSGDLEVLIEPGTAGHLQIQVVTSVDGSAARWAQLFQRLFVVVVRREMTVGHLRRRTIHRGIEDRHAIPHGTGREHEHASELPAAQQSECGA